MRTQANLPRRLLPTAAALALLTTLCVCLALGQWRPTLNDDVKVGEWGMRADVFKIP